MCFDQYGRRMFPFISLRASSNRERDLTKDANGGNMVYIKNGTHRNNLVRCADPLPHEEEEKVWSNSCQRLVLHNQQNLSARMCL